jgi:hypothetical protein
MSTPEMRVAVRYACEIPVASLEDATRAWEPAVMLVLEELSLLPCG